MPDRSLYRNSLCNCGNGLMLGGCCLGKLHRVVDARPHCDELSRHCGREDVVERLREDKRHFFLQLFRQVVKICLVTLWEDKRVDPCAPGGERFHLYAAYRE